MKLKEVLEKNIDKPIKIGGSGSGFIFCGTIHKNYSKMLKDLMVLKKEEYKDSLERNKNKKASMLETYKEKKESCKKQSSLKESYADYFLTFENKLDEQNRLIDKSRENYDMVRSVDILNEEVLDLYKSTIDDTCIVIIDKPLRGSFVDRKEMMDDKRYSEFAKEYNI